MYTNKECNEIFNMCNMFTDILNIYFTWACLPGAKAALLIFTSSRFHPFKQNSE